MANIENNRLIKTVDVEEDVNPKKKTWITPDVITEDVSRVTASGFTGVGSDNVIYS